MFHGVLYSQCVVSRLYHLNHADVKAEHVHVQIHLTKKKIDPRENYRQLINIEKKAQSLFNGKPRGGTQGPCPQPPYLNRRKKSQQDKQKQNRVPP